MYEPHYLSDRQLYEYCTYFTFFINNPSDEANLWTTLVQDLYSKCK